jgi:stage II sporulation SpoE-like protein
MPRRGRRPRGRCRRAGPRILSWANTALIERAGTSFDYVTATCVTYLPSQQILRWAYAGHPPALALDDGELFGLGGVRAALGPPCRPPQLTPPAAVFTRVREPARVRERRRTDACPRQSAP